MTSKNNNINIHIQLKGLFTIFCLSFKSHILDSNGVWYSWFWPEGSINAQNSKFLVFHFVPRDLDSRRHKGPWLTAQGTWTRGAGDLDSLRHRFESHGRLSSPTAKISYTTPHYYPKYEIWTIDKKIVNNPFIGIQQVMCNAGWKRYLSKWMEITNCNKWEPRSSVTQGSGQ